MVVIQSLYGSCTCFLKNAGHRRTPKERYVSCKKIIFTLFRSLSSVRQRRVVVTGLGVVSPLGCGVVHSWTNLMNGSCGVVKLNGDQYEKLPCKVAAMVPKGSGVGKFDTCTFTKSEARSMTPATSYALTAAKEALTDACWLPEDTIGKENTGVAVGLGMVDLVDVCETAEALKQGYSKVSPYFVPRILPNMAAGQISIKYGFRGPNHTVSTACATGVHAIGDGFRFVQRGDASVMVCGGAEACVSPLSIAAFCRLRALSTKYNHTPERASRPFDKGRDGFVMGEGSAILILEELEHAKRRNAKIYAEILGYGLSGDASHLTAPRQDGSGAVLAMSRGLNDAGVKLGHIGYINAHATSTPLGDAIESHAVKQLFGPHSTHIAVSSTKGAHGHLLGAAGNLEAVFTILACYHGSIPPTINLDNLETEMDLNYVPNDAIKWEQKNSRRIALKNAFGFGGTNASLCIAQYME